MVPYTKVEESFNVQEFRFIIGSLPMLNVSASLAASRIYNNRKKNVWKWLYVILLGSFVFSLGCSLVTFMASYQNYPGGYALKALHQADVSTGEKLVHIDTFTAMNGVSHFSESEYPWRYSKEEGIAVEEYRNRNFTYLLNEHGEVASYKFLFAVNEPVSDFIFHRYYCLKSQKYLYMGM